MKIEILGSGCPKCRTVEENVKKALAELKKQAEVVKVSDIEAIIEKGVLQTPAMAINDKLIFQGKTPTTEQIKEIIKKEEGTE